MSDIKTNTGEKEISQEELHSLVGAIGADIAMTPDTGEPEPTEKKSTFFDREKKVDLTFLDEEDDPDPDPVPNNDDKGGEGDDDDPQPDPKDKITDDDLKELLDKDLEVDNDDDDPEPKKKGRKEVKTGMAQLTQSLIEDEFLIPFDDGKAIEDYTVEDFKELYKLNFEHKEKQLREQTPKEFFEALPHELQYAAKYVAEGGKDLKGLFRALATSEETKSMDISSEQGQETIVREYLRATRFGNDQEIQEEIESWKDMDKLEAKANQFKPKLDKMQEQVVQRQIAEQEYKKKQQEAAALQYAENIHQTLSQEDLDGLKLNDKTRNMLYQGLIQPNYKSSSGASTNMFGHLIEQHQFVKPNHGLIAQALWLLADPEGFKKEIRKTAKNEAAAETARKLKIEQNNKTGSGSGDEPEPGSGKKESKGLPRPNKNFFRRG